MEGSHQVCPDIPDHPELFPVPKDVGEQILDGIFNLVVVPGQFSTVGMEEVKVFQVNHRQSFFATGQNEFVPVTAIILFVCFSQSQSRQQFATKKTLLG